MSGALFKENSNEKIWYNHPQLLGIHKAPKSLWEQQIREAQETDLDYKDYKNREMQLEVIYIPSKVAKEFVIEFYKGVTQRYNGATVLVIRLGKEYIIWNIWKIAKEVTKECPDY